MGGVGGLGEDQPGSWVTLCSSLVRHLPQEILASHTTGLTGHPSHPLIFQERPREGLVTWEPIAWLSRSWVLAPLHPGVGQADLVGEF